MYQDWHEEEWFGCLEESLPQTREEFEARAILFYIMKQIQEFLILKNQFIR